ncbi:MAG: TIGR03364 family FAD-dependent oxidoreductase [Flavisolibacter sp.]
MSESAIVIGAGIIGLATARALCVRGYKVTIVEASGRATGASIRNFGMIWPIGQPLGKLYERSLLSRSIWKQVCEEANIWFDEVGSLHLAYHPLEGEVLEEFFDLNRSDRDIMLLDAGQTERRCARVKNSGLKNSLFSRDEVIVNPRTALPAIATYLNKKYDVKLIFNAKVTQIDTSTVSYGKHTLRADKIYLCNGAEFETVFPEIFKALPLTKCKLQMMRLEKSGAVEKLGTSLCGGLSLIHYKSFEAAPSLALLKGYYKKELSDYLSWGIHVMICQNESGQYTLGDSHEYGPTHDPFNKELINEKIITYLKTFTNFKNLIPIESWNGIYAKLTHNRTEIVLSPLEGVYIINGLGGAGMTFSFGLCEQVIAETYTA